MMVDTDTELLNVSVRPGVLVYNYRLVNATALTIAAQQVVDRLKPPATNQACSTPETRQGLLERGVTMRFSYSDGAGVYIVAFDVTLAGCS